jgi:hypothetical protein
MVPGRGLAVRAARGVVDTRACGQAAVARRGVYEVDGWGVVVAGETPVPRRPSNSGAQ